MLALSALSPLFLGVAQAAPEGAIVGATLDPSNPTPGQTVDWEVIVRNTGTDSWASWDAGLSVYRHDGTGVGYNAGGSTQPSLEPGQERTARIRFYDFMGGQEPGDYYYNMYVDADDAEGQETILRRDHITFSLENPACSGSVRNLRAEPSQTTRGQIVSFSWELWNTGSLQWSSIDQQVVYIDYPGPGEWVGLGPTVAIPGPGAHEDYQTNRRVDDNWPYGTYGWRIAPVFTCDNGEQYAVPTKTGPAFSVTELNQRPVQGVPSCSPNPSKTGQSVTCSFSATDDSTGVYYTMNWGDGSATTRVPSSGTVSPGSTRTAPHTWNAEGSYTVSVTATDNAPTPLTADPATTQQSVSTCTVSLSGPSDREQVTGRPALSWSGTSECVSYEVQVWGSTDFLGRILGTIAINTWMPNEPLEPATYYWRVKGADSYGQSEWTPYRTFVVPLQLKVVFDTSGSGKLQGYTFEPIEVPIRVTNEGLGPVDLGTVSYSIAIQFRTPNPDGVPLVSIMSEMHGSVYMGALRDGEQKAFILTTDAIPAASERFTIQTLTTTVPTILATHIQLSLQGPTAGHLATIATELRVDAGRNQLGKAAYCVVEGALKAVLLGPITSTVPDSVAKTIGEAYVDAVFEEMKSFGLEMRSGNTESAARHLSNMLFYMGQGYNGLTFQQKVELLRDLPGRLFTHVVGCGADLVELLASTGRLIVERLITSGASGLKAVGIFSPLDVYVEDANGRITGFKDGSSYNDVPSAWIHTVGDKKILVYAADADLRLRMEGNNNGTARVVYIDGSGADPVVVESDNFSVQSGDIVSIVVGNGAAEVRVQGIRANVLVSEEVNTRTTHIDIARLSVANVAIISEPLRPNRAANVSVEIKNAGGTHAFGELVFLSDSVVVERRALDVAARGSAAVSIIFVANHTGPTTLKLQLNGNDVWERHVNVALPESSGGQVPGIPAVAMALALGIAALGVQRRRRF